jgi:SAM-dependent methyltransferase
MWDDRYSSEEFAYGKEPNDFLAQNTDKLPKGRVLCLAEGEGRNAVHLAKHGFDVVAVDSSSVGLQKAQRLADEAGVSITIEVADLAHYEIEPNSFDAVVSIFCHLPPPLRAELHTRCVTGLNPGGVMLLEAYTPDQLKYGTGGPPMTEMMMSLNALQQELDGLEFQLAHEIERTISEGQFHDGMGAVVQLIAVKSA